MVESAASGQALAASGSQSQHTPGSEAVPPLLAIDAVDVFYGPIQALFGVSVSVGEGETVVVLGGNASGKSTTVKTALGLVKPRAGSVTFRGERIDGTPTHDVIGLGFGSIPEGRRVFVEMSVADNIRLGAYTRRRAEKGDLAADLDAVYEMFPRLAERRNQTAGTLSGGEQQMLAMARAFMRKPKLLCIDEPSMGLSPLMVERVYETLGTWQKAGLTMLIVEQNAMMALGLAHRGYVLRQGHVIIEGLAADLLEDDTVRLAYLGG
ncbi:MAG: ABC transporter ATP-binding protein [Pseudomonadota bacterium]